MKAAVLQLPAIGMSSTKLFHYIRIAHKKGVKLLVLGEYLLNPFFKELEKTPIAMIKEQSEHQLSVLKELSRTYDLTIVAPLITVKKGAPYKSIVKVSPSSTAYYYQQVLINYTHWNEEKFFANEIEAFASPMVFTVDRFKFAVMGGYELHFDELWYYVSLKNVDAVLIPTVSTFESQQRWRDLLRMRAFTHNCYVLRANRIGEHISKEGEWRFYGDSLLMSPHGEMEAHLGNTEELMIVDMDHREVVDARRTWGFKEAAHKRML